MSNNPTLSYVEAVRGYPYMRKKEVAEEFKISERTVTNYIKEIEAEILSKRYNDYALIQDGKIVLINILVFLDYMKYRTALKNGTTRKHVPQFNPDQLVQIMGWSNRLVSEAAG